MLSHSSVCREQWIRAKYERKEFVEEVGDSRPSYMTGGLLESQAPVCTVVFLSAPGTKKGFLYKKKKIDNVWQSRFFVLDRETLRYYKKIGVSKKKKKFKRVVCACFSCV